MDYPAVGTDSSGSFAMISASGSSCLPTATADAGTSWNHLVLLYPYPCLFLYPFPFPFPFPFLSPFLSPYLCAFALTWTACSGVVLLKGIRPWVLDEKVNEQRKAQTLEWHLGHHQWVV